MKSCTVYEVGERREEWVLVVAERHGEIRMNVSIGLSPVLPELLSVPM